MKKSLAQTYLPPPVQHRITKALREEFNRKMANQTKEILDTVTPPSEEKIILLNRIGREYPFCVFYKQKMNDPL